MIFWYFKLYSPRLGDAFVTNLNVSNSYSMYIDYKLKN